MEIEQILEQWDWAGYSPDLKSIPDYIVDNISVKLFTNTPASGDKGTQTDILVDLFDCLTIKQLYNLGFLPDAWILEEYQTQKDNDDSYIRDYKEFNE
jgi:hypothetical protein